jgi:hypothetical protein
MTARSRLKRIVWIWTFTIEEGGRIGYGRNELHSRQNRNHNIRTLPLPPPGQSTHADRLPKAFRWREPAPSK